jgi:hypothetical protein
MRLLEIILRNYTSEKHNDNYKPKTDCVKLLTYIFQIGGLDNRRSQFEFRVKKRSQNTILSIDGTK